MKILLHIEYKIINLWYPTYVYQFLNFPYNYKNRVLACFQTRPTFCQHRMEEPKQLRENNFGNTLLFLWFLVLVWLLLRISCFCCRRGKDCELENIFLKLLKE